MDVTAIIVAASIPSALTGFFFWLIEQSIQKRADKEKAEREERQKEVDAREQIREKNELCIINCVNASLALGEATARAVQRIPDAHCNGDMHAALDLRYSRLTTPSGSSCGCGGVTDIAILDSIWISQFSVISSWDT